MTRKNSLINGTIFGKKIIGGRLCGLIFCTNLSKTFLVLRRIQKGIPINAHGPPSSCHFLINLEFSWQVFEKFSNIKFHENSSRRSRVISYGQRDKTRLTATFSQCFKRADTYNLYTSSAVYTSKCCDIMLTVSVKFPTYCLRALVTKKLTA